MQTDLLDATKPRSIAQKKRLYPASLADVNWYQVAIIALTVLAVSFELAFPPSRFTLANGLTVYAGHFLPPAYGPVTLQLDYSCLAIELLAILALAAVGWNLGTASKQHRGAFSNSTQAH